VSQSRATSEKAAPHSAIRRASEADLPRIVELLSQLSLDDGRDSPADPLPESYRTALREIQADPRQQLLVAEAEGRLVATATLGIVPNLSYRGKPWAFVESIVVDDWARGRGYGEALVRYAIQEARRAGCYKVSLTSNKRRSEAHRFYEKLGFTASHEGFRLTL
jgi:N-acetylglutamate synthase-like GNAT family acetyltransferase